MIFNGQICAKLLMLFGLLVLAVAQVSNDARAAKDRLITFLPDLQGGYDELKDASQGIAPYNAAAYAYAILTSSELAEFLEFALSPDDCDEIEELTIALRCFVVYHNSTTIAFPEFNIIKDIESTDFACRLRNWGCTGPFYKDIVTSYNSASSPPFISSTPPPPSPSVITSLSESELVDLAISGSTEEAVAALASTMKFGDYSKVVKTLISAANDQSDGVWIFKVQCWRWHSVRICNDLIADIETDTEGVSYNDVIQRLLIDPVLCPCLGKRVDGVYTAQKALDDLQSQGITVYAIDVDKLNDNNNQYNDQGNAEYIATSTGGRLESRVNPILQSDVLGDIDGLLAMMTQFIIDFVNCDL